MITTWLPTFRIGNSQQGFWGLRKPHSHKCATLQCQKTAYHVLCFFSRMGHKKNWQQWNKWEIWGHFWKFSCKMKYLQDHSSDTYINNLDTFGSCSGCFSTHSPEILNPFAVAVTNCNTSKTLQEFINPCSFFNNNTNRQEITCTCAQLLTTSQNRAIWLDLGRPPACPSICQDCPVLLVPALLVPARRPPICLSS